jgi:hypothetical protein
VDKIIVTWRLGKGHPARLAGGLEAVTSFRSWKGTRTHEALDNVVGSSRDRRGMRTGRGLREQRRSRPERGGSRSGGFRASCWWVCAGSGHAPHARAAAGGQAWRSQDRGGARRGDNCDARARGGKTRDTVDSGGWFSNRRDACPGHQPEPGRELAAGERADAPGRTGRADSAGRDGHDAHDGPRRSTEHGPGWSRWYDGWPDAPTRCHGGWPESRTKSVRHGQDDGVPNEDATTEGSRRTRGTGPTGQARSTGDRRHANARWPRGTRRPGPFAGTG